MKRVDLHANTPYALRRADDSIVPAMLLDSSNLWMPLSDASGLFRVSNAQTFFRSSPRALGLLVASLLTPGEGTTHFITRERLVRRFADRVLDLPPLGIAERTVGGLASWLERIAISHRGVPLQLEVVHNARLLHPWGTPSVRCRECKRDGIELDEEGRLRSHDRRPPLRELCPAGGSVRLGDDEGETL